MKPLRSYLYAPGSESELVRKVFHAGADAVILDLEDAVPESEKARARALVAKRLREVEKEGSAPVFVRINHLGSAHWRDDIAAVAGASLAGVRVPKAESLADMCRLNDALSDRERILGLGIGSIAVVATLESARGLVALESLASAPRLAGFAFGAADYCADIAADPAEEPALLFALSRLVAVSRSRRLAPPIASVFIRLDDDAALRSDTERHKRLGFFGRSAIHPRQVPVIHAAFRPTPGEVSEAEGIVEAFERAGGAGRAAVHSGRGFVDLAVVRRARALLALHDLSGEDRP